MAGIGVAERVHEGPHPRGAHRVPLEPRPRLTKRLVLGDARGEDLDRSRRSPGLDHAFRLALTRAPTAWELSKLDKYFAAQLEQYQTAPKSAEALLKADAGAGINLMKCALPAEITTAERAAWTAVTRVLLNLDEFITRE